MSTVRSIVAALFVTILAAGLIAPPAAASPVHVDHFGYRPAEARWVAVASPGVAPATFEVRRASDNAVAWSGPLTLRRNADPASGDNVYQGLFTGLTATGEYFVRVAGLGDSPPFLIHDGVYDALYRRLLKGLFYQRCGFAITSAFGGDWTHDACHDEGSAIASYDWTSTGGAPTRYHDTIGGWHDAGDYGKYSTNNAYAVGVLLRAYELWPARYPHDDVGIPESGNGVPDLLDEARWSLAWMLKMQLADGSVRHRESVAVYAGEYLPELEPTRRYYTSISSDATAVHCAAMALAARVYGPFDPAFAAACSTSAVTAWNWLLAHPNRVPTGGFVNLYGHTGATYIAGSETGRRLWAAAEIFRLNGATAARNFFDANWGDGKTFNGVWYPDGWGDVANLGAFAYRDAPGATTAIRSGSWWSIENSTLSSAAGWSSRVSQDGYGCAASADGGGGDYYWGFTGVILRYAWAMIEAYRYDGNPAYEQAALEQLHYIIGRNPMGKVYVTGLAENSVLHPHGAWNLAAGYVNVANALCHPVPYLLIGGPNRADNSDISPYPGKCYEDIADPDYYNKGNYTLNETAVNIQAALIVLAGYFSSGNTVTGVPDDGGPDAPPSPQIVAAPNPFTGGTTLRWSPGPGGAPGPAGGRQLRVIDARGRLVRSIEAPGPGAGVSEIFWDGMTGPGVPAPAGVYFVRPPGRVGEAARIVKVGR